MDKFTNNIIDIAHNHYNYLMNLENVVGVGRGHKFINGINIKEPCVHVLVKNKVEKNFLTKNNIIPNRYMGIKTDVIEVGEFVAAFGDVIFPNRFRSLESGCVIGLQGKLFSGTLGCIVSKYVKVELSDKQFSLNKEYYLLSCNHAIANSNEAPLGSLVIQPSKYYKGAFPKDLVGVLDYFVAIDFITNSNTPENQVDCAIARIVKKADISNKILSLGKIKHPSKAELDMDVRKVGFVTGVTEGKITTLNTTSTVAFLNGKRAYFIDQIIASATVDSGDSGGCLFTEDNEVLGLIMAKAKKTNYSICNDINIVFKKLGVKLYTG